MVAASKEHSTHAGVPVRTCAGLRMPAVAAGPVILLPEASAAWPPFRLQMVLAHEIAHVRRRDLWWRPAGTLACCLFWFHPLAWWAAAQQRKESEMACDDLVLRTYPSAAYAEELVGVAREASGYNTPVAVMAMAKPRELEKRLVAVLDSGRRRANVSHGRRHPWCQIVTPRRLRIHFRNRIRRLLHRHRSPRRPIFDRGPEARLRPPRDRPAESEAGKTARADFHLQLGGIRETVNVAGDFAAADSNALAAPQRIRISGNVQAAKLVHKVVPSYPKEAKTAGIQGTVRLEAISGKEGDVVRLTLIMSPSAELARSAMEAVAQWKYQPTLLNGDPVEIQTVVDVNYTLTK